VNVTISVNTSVGGAAGANGGTSGGADGGGADLVGGGGVAIANMIVRGSCSGIAGASLGGNVESAGDTCGLTEPDDLVNVADEALALDPLAANGGHTETRAISSSSAAAGRGRNANCEPIGQRGVSRPASGCDSGACEAP